MNYQPFLKCLTIVLPVLALAAMAERANGNATAYQAIKLQEQVARADHVAHVIILEVQSLDHVDNGPVQSCGLKYHVRVVERFKGELDTQITAFATDRFLLPYKRLRTGDHVLVLLRNVSDSVNAVAAADTRLLEESVAMSAGTEACRRARGDFYLPDFAENSFAITFEQGSKAWFEFSERTIISAEIGASLLPRCEPVAGGCIRQGAARVEWKRVRDALIAAKKREK